jgi:ClpP class serine protease
MDDETLILADVARKAMTQVHRTVVDILLGNDVPEDKARAIAEALSCGQWTHDYPISAEEAAELGLNVTTELPDEVCDLMELYRQAAQRRPSVQYIPVPYRREEQPEKGK